MIRFYYIHFHYNNIIEEIDLVSQDVGDELGNRNRNFQDSQDLDDYEELMSSTRFFSYVRTSVSLKISI